jgi:hypothetical protein
MTTKHTHRHTAGAVSQAGLILSLVGTLDNPRSPLGRRASTLAHRRCDGGATTADLDAAAAVISTLLDATDCGLPIDGEYLLDSGFDA